MLNFLFADSIIKFFIWISAEVRSCAQLYVFLSTNSAVGFCRILLWKWLKRSCLHCTNDNNFLTVFEGSFKDVDIINMFLA